jgi:hypothetical protein
MTKPTAKPTTKPTDWWSPVQPKPEPPKPADWWQAV